MNTPVRTVIHSYGIEVQSLLKDINLNVIQHKISLLTKQIISQNEVYR